MDLQQVYLATVAALTSDASRCRGTVVFYTLYSEPFRGVVDFCFLGHVGYSIWVLGSLGCQGFRYYGQHLVSYPDFFVESILIDILCSQPDHRLVIGNRASKMNFIFSGIWWVVLLSYLIFDMATWIYIGLMAKIDKIDFLAVLSLIT